MKRVLITGATGMLGATLVKMWTRKYQVFATASRESADVQAVNFKAFDLVNHNYQELVNWSRPEAIIHGGAITDVDACENNRRKTLEVNGDSVFRFLTAAPEAKLIYISTDAVFPRGTHMASEETPIAPINVYGESKELGESFIKKSPKNNCIVRTTIVGKNINHLRCSFAEWIVNSLRQKMKIKLYDNIYFTPISIWHFADELEWIINHETPRVLHVGGAEIISKYQFGVNLALKMGLDISLIKQVKATDANFVAPRNFDQTLSSKLYEKISKRKLPDVKTTINEIVMAF